MTGSVRAVRWMKRRRIQPPMGLQSVIGAVDLLSSSCGGDGGGYAMDPITGGPPLVPLDLDLGARVPVGRLCSPMRIRVLKWCCSQCDDNSMGEGKILTRSSSSSSSSSTPPCPLPLA
jgi:hypothetical protein